MEAFALKAGIEPSYLSKKLRGSQPITKKDISQISVAANLSTEWLLEGGSPIELINKKLPLRDVPQQTVPARIMEYLNYKGIKTARAEKDCGLSNGLLGNAFRNNASIGSDNIEKILNTYQDLSAEWLLRGEGSMLIGDGLDKKIVFKSFGMPANSDKIIEYWRQFVKSQKGMIELFDEEEPTQSVQKTCN